MYEQKRKEVNKAAEKFEKQLKAAKKSGSKANTDKVCHPDSSYMVPYPYTAHVQCFPLHCFSQPSRQLPGSP